VKKGGIYLVPEQLYFLSWHKPVVTETQRWTSKLVDVAIVGEVVVEGGQASLWSLVNSQSFPYHH
jgi:hypothetical protein